MMSKGKYNKYKIEEYTRCYFLELFQEAPKTYDRKTMNDGLKIIVNDMDKFHVSTYPEIVPLLRHYKMRDPKIKDFIDYTKKAIDHKYNSSIYLLEPRNFKKANEGEMNLLICRLAVEFPNDVYESADNYFHANFPKKKELLQELKKLINDLTDQFKTPQIFDIENSNHDHDYNQINLVQQIEEEDIFTNLLTLDSDRIEQDDQNNTNSNDQNNTNSNDQNNTNSNDQNNTNSNDQNNTNSIDQNNTNSNDQNNTNSNDQNNTNSNDQNNTNSNDQNNTNSIDQNNTNSIDQNNTNSNAGEQNNTPETGSECFFDFDLQNDSNQDDFFFFDFE